MNSIAFATHYPVACPACQTITARRASELLQDKRLLCRGCSVTIPLNEAQLNRLRRTVADLGDCHRRSAEHYQPPAATPDSADA